LRRIEHDAGKEIDGSRRGFAIEWALSMARNRRPALGAAPASMLV
jgi:hypothetical protein